MFPLLITLILVAVVATLTAPLWRGSSSSAPSQPAALEAEGERIDLLIEKERLLQALTDLKIEVVGSAVADVDRIRDDNEHRLAAVLQRLDVLATQAEPAIVPPPVNRRSGTTFGATILLGVIVVGGSVAVYRGIHWKWEQAGQDATAGAEIGDPKVPAIDPVAMVARLEERLKKNPDDLQGQIMAGRSYMTLSRWEDAKKAWRKVVELDPRNDMAHYNIGEILIRTTPPGDKTVAAEALAHFDQALINLPQEPTILWARGIALVQLGRTFEADEAWTAAYQAIPPNTQASEMVKQALNELRSGKPLF